MDYAERFLADKAKVNTQEATPVVETEVVESTIPEPTNEEVAIEEVIPADVNEPVVETPVDDTLLPVAEEQVVEQVDTGVRKEWIDMDVEEKKVFVESQKKEYDKYNTQNSQVNAKGKKELEEEIGKFQKYVNDTQRYFDGMANNPQMQQGSSKGQERVQETEAEALTRLSGIPLDEFSSDAEIATAKRIVEQDQMLNENQQRTQQAQSQKAIDSRYSKWETLRNDPENNIPKTKEFEQSMFAMVLGNQTYNKNYDVEDAVKDINNMMGVNTEEDFIKYAKGSKFYSKLEAQVITDIRNRQAGTPRIPSPTGKAVGTPPKKYVSTGKFGDSMNAFFANRNK